MRKVVMAVMMGAVISMEGVFATPPTPWEEWCEKTAQADFSACACVRAWSAMTTLYARDAALADARAALAMKKCGPECTLRSKEKNFITFRIEEDDKKFYITCVVVEAF